jgi:ABC-type glycerol-3-phosphate transport system substrate-binding protein
MRRWLILFPLIFLISCKGERGKSKGLIIWESYNDEEHSVFMEIVNAYLKTHPDIKIEVQRIPFTGMEQKILTALAAKSTPDIARVDYAFVAKLADKNALVPIGEDEIGELKEQLIEAALEANRYKGTLYGLPDQATCLVLFYNPKILKEAGVEKPPETWEEFVKIGRRITDPERGIYAFGMHNSLWWTFPFFFSFGAKFLSEDGKRCLLDSKEAIEAFTLKVDLYRKYKIEAGAWKAGAVNPDMGFRNGKYAMIFSGPWSVKSLKAGNIPFKIALIPEGPAGSRTVTGGTNMVIFRREKKFLALDFLRYLLSPEVQAKWANELGQIPVNKGAFPLVDTLKHPELKVFLKQMETAVPRPPIPTYSEIELIFNGEMEAALSGQKSPEEALKSAVSKVNREILGVNE